MGLLKHFILPLLALVHGVITAVAVTGGLAGAVIDSGALAPDYTMTGFEDHCLFVMGGVHMMLFFACVMGLAIENSHFRGIYIVSESIFFGHIAYSDVKHGYPAQVSVALACLSVFGAIVHSQEPGLFAKDKDKTKTG
jgi:hypothetical protein